MTTLSVPGARTPLILVVVLLLGCAGIQRVPTPPVVAADPGSVEVSLFLIGDAGAPAPDEPVLIALRN